MLLLIVILIHISSIAVISSDKITAQEYMKDKIFPIARLYLFSLGELDDIEKEIIDALYLLPENRQHYYAMRIYEIINETPTNLSKESKITLRDEINKEIYKTSASLKKESIIDDVPSIIKKIKPSVVIVLSFDKKGKILSQGSGFIINWFGEIITNFHVIDRAKSIKIKTSDGEFFSVSHILAKDEKNDLICLETDMAFKKEFPPLLLSKTLPEIGEKIIVYGSPLGLENTVSDGIVSAIRYHPEFGKIIQITAPISPGSSGSPVLNMYGEVIGIASFQIVEGQNLNFAIPSERIDALIKAPRKKISITEGLYEQPNPELLTQAVQHWMDGMGLIFENKYAEAIPHLERVLEILYSDKLLLEEHKDLLLPEIYRELGISYLHTNSYIKAIESLKNSITLKPDGDSQHYYLGIAYTLIGDFNLALIEHEILKELNPDDARDLLNFIKRNFLK